MIATILQRASPLSFLRNPAVNQGFGASGIEASLLDSIKRSLRTAFDINCPCFVQKVTQEAENNTKET